MCRDNIKSQSKLKNILHFTGLSEVKMESRRQKLCKLQGFEPYTAFRRIDRKNTGFINKQSLCKF
jgi:hypothetical protein